MDLNTLINQAKAATSQLEDQSQASAGGDFEYETPPAGTTQARFIGYVEVGVRPQRPYQGTPKPDAEEVRLYFELNGKKHKKEVGEGDDKKIITNMIAVKVVKKQSEKASFYKLFKKMQYGRDGITHMADMLGDAFLIDIVHNTVEGKDGAKDRTYANMRDVDGNWLIGAPRVKADPLDEDSWTDVPVDEPRQNPKVLLWNAPSKEMWESIFIDGTRTVKNEKGEEVEVSKNWLQEDIVQNAKNFAGSPLEAVIGGVADLTLDDDVIEPDAPADEQGGGAAVNPDDALAALGL